MAAKGPLLMLPRRTTNAKTVYYILSRLARWFLLFALLLHRCTTLCSACAIEIKLTQPNMKLLTITLAAAVATASSIPRAPAAALSGCSSSRSRACGQPSGQVNNVTITSGGLQRSFLLWIPPSYQPSQQTAAILSYHGGNDDATDQLQLDKLTDPEFNTESVVVYPQGINVSASVSLRLRLHKLTKRCPGLLAR